MGPFPRQELAGRLIASLQGKDFLGDAHNGLFLAAPRRTGKSTFLQGDLLPALQAAGIVAVYVDLWADPTRDPGHTIAEGIARALQPQLGTIARLARSAGLEKVSVAGLLHIDLSRIGKVDGLTLVDALRALHQAAGKPVALIVDEAQHALTSAAGEAAMTALKSARDQLNRPGRVDLMLVMSGSDRDKLLRLVHGNAAPFFGSTVHQMPLLGRDFIEHIAGLVAARRPELGSIDVDRLHEAFELFGSRPQFFMEALGQVLSPLAPQEPRFEQAMLEAARDRQRQDEAQMESDYLGLRPLQQAVLWRLLEQGARFRPYDSEALRFYADKVGTDVSVPMVQTALSALRVANPPIAWKSTRGDYSVEDAAMYRWYQQRAEAGTWPPRPSGPADWPPLPGLDAAG